MTSPMAATPAGDGPALENSAAAEAYSELVGEEREEEEEDPAEPAMEASSTADTAEEKDGGEEKRWPGWPGENVFRLIVPVAKVGGIIGHKGELIKKLCEETRARVRILDGPVGNPDRVVLVSGREEPEAEVSPAMEAALRIFKRVNGISEIESTAANQASTAMCSVRLLVASSQAISLIGKQGSVIKSIQENSGASVRVLSGDEVPLYATTDERVIEIQGESFKVLKALEAVVGHLRKFLIDHSVLPLFEKNLKMQFSQECLVDAWSDKAHSSVNSAKQPVIGNNYPLSTRDPLFLDRESHLDPQAPRSEMLLYGRDPGRSGLHSPGFGRAPGALVTQVTQTMQIPLMYAEDIIGVEGKKIAYIRRTSGALLTVKESAGFPDEIIVEIKGTSQEVQTAQQLIQDFIAGHREPEASSYGSLDAGFRSSYSQPSGSVYSSHLYGRYGSNELGGYGSYRF